MKHANVAVFVPHAGCPQQCSFCNQRFISGTHNSPKPEDVLKIIENAAKTLSESGKPAQIAFFGGSFTAVDLEYMVSLLQSVQKYLDSQCFSSIRISTRPDAIDEKRLEILKKYRVTDIELGAQSMNNDVLKANFRGHTAEDTINAANLIKSYRFGLGLQMMTGLYEDDSKGSLESARQIAELEPKSVRIYPTVVLRGTHLAQLYNTDEYIPQTLEEAVEGAANLLHFFTEKNIPVIRLGLHDSPDLNENILAGPHHPAFRELVESRILLRKVLLQIESDNVPCGNIFVEVRSDSISKMIGQKRVNLRKLADLGYFATINAKDNIEYLDARVLLRK